MKKCYYRATGWIIRIRSDISIFGRNQRNFDYKLVMVVLPTDLMVRGP